MDGEDYQIGWSGKASLERWHFSTNAWKGKGVKCVMIIIWGAVSVKALRQLGVPLACREWKGQQLGRSDKEACSVVKGGSDRGTLGEPW